MNISDITKYPYDTMVLYANKKSLYKKFSKKFVNLMSMTKFIVALLFSIFFQKETVNNDLSNKKIIDFYKNAKFDSITINNLLTHTGGIIEPVNNNDLYKSKDYVKYALDREINGKLINSYSYSNTGYIILGDIYQKLTGTNIKDGLINEFPFLKDNIKWSHDKNGNYGTAGDLLMDSKYFFYLILYLLKYKKHLLQYMILNKYAIYKTKYEKFYELQDGWLGQYCVINMKNDDMAMRFVIPKYNKYKDSDTMVKELTDNNFVDNAIDFFNKHS